AAGRARGSGADELFGGLAIQRATSAARVAGIAVEGSAAAARVARAVVDCAVAVIVHAVANFGFRQCLARALLRATLCITRLDPGMARADALRFWGARVTRAHHSFVFGTTARQRGSRGNQRQPEPRQHPADHSPPSRAQFGVEFLLRLT